MEEFLVKLRGGTYFSRYVRYTYVKAPTIDKVYLLHYSDDDGDLEIIDVTPITAQLIKDIQTKLRDIYYQRSQLFPMDERQVMLEHDMYECQQQLNTILNNNSDWYEYVEESTMDSVEATKYDINF